MQDKTEYTVTQHTEYGFSLHSHLRALSVISVAEGARLAAQVIEEITGNPDNNRDAAHRWGMLASQQCIGRKRT